MAKRNIAARKKLSALYAKGKIVRFSGDAAVEVDKDADPPSEEEVDVWVQPPSPLQREMALREAQASRSRAVLKAKNDKNSEDYLNALVFVSEMEGESLIDYVLTMDADDRQREAMRDVLSKKEWENFQDLQDAMRQFEEAEAEEDDPEYKDLIDRDVEFGTQVNARFLELTEAAREVLAQTPSEKLQKRAMDRRADLLASQTFMKVYEREMLFYSCRDVDDRSETFFEKSTDLMEYPEEVYQGLSDALASFISDGGQAKNSQGAAPSSDSSEPPAEPETSQASTPEDATE